MALKKSELYSSLWASCDALRGGMDASQYKDYVLVMLFLKYVSDKAENDSDALIEVPEGCSFKDIAALKGQKDIGERIDIAIGRLAEENSLQNVIDMISFNDEEKLGKGKELVDTVSKLVAIFEKQELNFSKNNAGGDDILGDAYEFLMRHFATESGKAKGQFYTPAEVSRIMAKVLGIKKAAGASQSFYDPTCGSGSLLLKIADECEGSTSLFGQEKDVSTAALAKMNMILHDNPTAVITKGQSTLSNPLFLDDRGYLKTFDYAVANPPFSLKNWTQGFNPAEDEFNRFTGYGIPPEKNGDYAFLLHIIHSLKSTGKGAVILPHGVLFRGNAESEIRKNLIERGLIKGIIGLPANLFYGTGIPACIIVIDKENASTRDGIFIIDASKGFMKDGNKNRLREQDLHRIVDVFNKQLDIPKYSRMVPVAEIKEKEYNLNIPRYIDSTEAEDLQNIEAHLLGGIPDRDIEELKKYWDVYEGMRGHLFKPFGRTGFSTLRVSKDAIKQEIFSHSSFLANSDRVNQVFQNWKSANLEACLSIGPDVKLKEFIHFLSEALLNAFSNLRLLDPYDVYQHMMDYWMEIMQDDVYLLVADGWKAGRQIEFTKKEFEGKLIPKSLMIRKYFQEDQDRINQLESNRDTIAAQIEELEEEHSGDEGYFADYDKVNKAAVTARLKELKPIRKITSTLSMAAEPDIVYGEKAVLEQYLELSESQTTLNKKIKEAEAELNKKLLGTYGKLTEEEIKTLIVEDKWMAHLESTIHTEMQRISHRLTQRIKELGERYDETMPELTKEVNTWEAKVSEHLSKMGYKF